MSYGGTVTEHVEIRLQVPKQQAETFVPACEAKADMATAADHSRKRSKQDDDDMSAGLTGGAETDGGADDLASYITRLTRTKLLTPTEERILARRVLYGDLAAKE